MEEQALSDDLETELSSAAIPISGGAKKKQLNINRYDLVSIRSMPLIGTITKSLPPMILRVNCLIKHTAVAAVTFGERGERG